MNKNVNEAKLMQILREKKEAQKHQPEKGAIYKPNEEKKHGTKGFRLSAISFRMTALCPLKSHLNKTSCTVTSQNQVRLHNKHEIEKYLRLLVLQNILHYVLPENPLISTSPANVVVWS